MYPPISRRPVRLPHLRRLCPGGLAAVIPLVPPAQRRDAARVPAVHPRDFVHGTHPALPGAQDRHDDALPQLGLVLWVHAGHIFLSRHPRGRVARRVGRLSFSSGR